MSHDERQELKIDPEYYDWWMYDNRTTLNGADPKHPLVTYLDTLFGRGLWVWIVPKSPKS